MRFPFLAAFVAALIIGLTGCEVVTADEACLKIHSQAEPDWPAFKKRSKVKDLDCKVSESVQRAEKLPSRKVGEIDKEGLDWAVDRD